jgi:hypothetical protein
MQQMQIKVVWRISTSLICKVLFVMVLDNSTEFSCYAPSKQNNPKNEPGRWRTKCWRNVHIIQDGRKEVSYSIYFRTVNDSIPFYGARGMELARVSFVGWTFVLQY